MAGYTNRLAKETSPYLLQHAHNPVDWYPWGEEALEKAKEENKPILVSIGYAACHWCHVMEKESFEDEQTAHLMNEHFVNIKIDREERPDLDHIYMDAVQAMTGSGGWPLNVFLTPQAKPFFGGTYFPPQRAFNRSSWQEILLAVSSAFHQKRGEIDSQAENLTAHLLQSNSFGLPDAGNTSNLFIKERVEDSFESLVKLADRKWGGFGKAPKFPQTFSIQFMLRYHYVTKNEEALSHALLSLDKMIEGGIYDQVGGGFARYSTDEKWLVPHFEKMLYDNALLVTVLAEAFQLTKKERYKEVIDETIEFIQRELMHPDGGFYSALDADSEGEEGKFYVWPHDEVKALLGTGSETFCNFYDITAKGNWEKTNILRIKKAPELFAEERGMSITELQNIIKTGRGILLKQRSQRTRPTLDDKVILSWNALMNAACTRAYAATGKGGFRQLAIRNMEFLFEKFENKEGNYFYHTWKNDRAKNFAFLDDYAFLILALLQLQEITGNTAWLLKAREITEYVVENFGEEETGFFFFTGKQQRDNIIRKKEVYDGATPSGNATMAYNMYQLSILLNIPGWRQRAEKMVSSLSNAIVRYPTSFGVWANLFMEMTYGTEEIAVVGENSFSLADQVMAEYIPHKVFMASPKANVEFPLLAEKPPTKPALIYLCREYSCLKPVLAVSKLLELINKGIKID